MKFKVDTGLLGTDVSNMKAALSSLRRCADSMQNALSSLDGMWAGEAHDSFAVQRDNDFQIFNSFINEMNERVNSIDDAKAEYDSCEERVLEKVRSITV